MRSLWNRAESRGTVRATVRTEAGASRGRVAGLHARPAGRARNSPRSAANERVRGRQRPARGENGPCRERRRKRNRGSARAPEKQEKTVTWAALVVAAYVKMRRTAPEPGRRSRTPTSGGGAPRRAHGRGRSAPPVPRSSASSAPRTAAACSSAACCCWRCCCFPPVARWPTTPGGRRSGKSCAPRAGRRWPRPGRCWRVRSAGTWNRSRSASRRSAAP